MKATLIGQLHVQISEIRYTVQTTLHRRPWNYRLGKPVRKRGQEDESPQKTFRPYKIKNTSLLPYCNLVAYMSPPKRYFHLKRVPLPPSVPRLTSGLCLGTPWADGVQVTREQCFIITHSVSSRISLGQINYHRPTFRKWRDNVEVGQRVEENKGGKTLPVWVGEICPLK